MDKYFESKREQISNTIGRISRQLLIGLDYVQENGDEYLVCNNQKICVTGMSIEGIQQEFFGYVFLLEWKDRSLGAFDKQVRNKIKEYWIK